MTTNTPLLSSESEIQAFLKQHPQWENIDGKLHRVYTFHHFREAFSFMTESALIAERMDHHPEWFNVYNRVEIDLVTHSAKGISLLDFELAAKMESIARRMQAD